MVQRSIKIPKHGGPDGQGLPMIAFQQLLEMVTNPEVDDEEIKKAMLLCLAISTQGQWNETYRIELQEKIK